MQLQGLDHLRLYPFDSRALGSFAQGDDHLDTSLQRVPKKSNEMKADLQNSTASQGDCVPLVILLKRSFDSLRSLRVTVVGRLICTEILRSPSRNL